MASLSCLPSTEPPEAIDPVLVSRPATPSATTATGRQEFGVAGSRAVVYVPESITREQPVGLVVFLHGAGRTVDPFVDAQKTIADTSRVIVLAPISIGRTWDGILYQQYSHDITVIDKSLEWVFQRWNIDPAKIAMTGFSDGATYALGVGLSNGDLFSHVVAYSPGFLLGFVPQGKPAIVISHGMQDPVLSFEFTKTSTVPRLEQLGYTVDFREFSGGHAMHLATARYVFNEIRTAAPPP